MEAACLGVLPLLRRRPALVFVENYVLDLRETLVTDDALELELPDPDLMNIVQTRLTSVIARMCLDGRIPRDDWRDGAEAYRQIYMRLWLELYGRALYRHGSRDAAVMMASHLGVLNELGREAFRMVERMFRWKEIRVLA